MPKRKINKLLAVSVRNDFNYYIKKFKGRNDADKFVKVYLEVLKAALPEPTDRTYKLIK